MSGYSPSSTYTATPQGRGVIHLQATLPPTTSTTHVATDPHLSPLSLHSPAPPSLLYSKSPYTFIPLPRLHNGPVRINPLLEYLPVPMIEYDVTLPATFATLNSRRREALDRSLDEPATSPATSSLTLCSSSFPKPVIAFPNNAQHPFVTVRDVLAAVHDAIRVFAIELHHPPPAYNLWGSPIGRVQTHQSQAAISDAHVRQLIMEFFPGGSIWAGISPSPAEPDVWILHVR
ncbi:uncharacterized protein LACBIDRAFT_327950 [Laccaria bicolor S238N-H82]|uniref:Predicted protein n=1 Tax=Laccaria bicolor (strain S238N-H82 / ATCC MYA-4686) TaxID=486041 RepID=B0DDC1_LACBS|nr:uncharacterized protein LACBIDRAFT_327950 [Laccaria bicolor S238N-H82]EDR07444.1 predicted protein [Laccaria bicolor S238N-H82]|eukprot:XP_001881836.1 predicted protein [Laccaria bicolor S238N-H82]